MQLKYLIIQVWKVFMRFIYFFFKLLKKQNKITFMSRQTDTRNIDFELLVEEIKKRDASIKTIVLNRRLEKGVKAKITYGIYMFKQMYHMATSKVLIIDSYSILVSILNQKKETKVIQIWHALGSLKKFGYSILGKKEGRNPKTAKVMDMHKHNDYIITSSEISKKYFMEAFNAKEEQMIVLGLPRIDFLQSKTQEKNVKEKFYSIYEELNNNKENILYVPTDRKGKKVKVDKVVKSIDYSKYNLIVKTHTGREIMYVDSNRIEKGIFFLGLELLHVADYIITDYSAIVYEASLVNKPIYFYTYDYNEYMKNRGVYINYKKEMPGLNSKNINVIMKAIEEKKWNQNKITQFANTYIEKRNINITEQLVNMIFEILKKGKIEIKEITKEEIVYSESIK